MITHFRHSEGPLTGRETRGRRTPSTRTGRDPSSPLPESVEGSADPDSTPDPVEEKSVSDDGEDESDDGEGDFHTSSIVEIRPRVQCLRGKNEKNTPLSFVQTVP